MKKEKLILITSVLFLLISIFKPETTLACSTFKLQKGNELIYGHNLNEGDIDVPGMIFINKRGIFKNGRTWSEIKNKNRENPSTFSWISRYGSVTFNFSGKDLPDGGMNEAGLYIWEMNEEADYPQNDSLPKLMHMNWMQFVLDNYSTLEEAVQSASMFQIDGWTWHYFISDSKGDCASLAFINGKVKVNRGSDMPVPALFNTPYDREMELLKYYKGFGGFYDIELNNSKVPRFVKTAAMIRDYDPAVNAVDYGFEMLKNITVNDEPEWSVIFDAKRMDVYFKTRTNPEIKHFSMNSCDFTNNSPVLILDIAIPNAGEIFDQFKPYSNADMKAFIETKVLSVIPEEFYGSGGLSAAEFADRLSSHTDSAAVQKNQYFAGTWKNKTEKPDDMVITVRLWTEKNAVYGEVSNSKWAGPALTADHLNLQGNKLVFTFKTASGTVLEVQALLDGNQMQIHLQGIEDDFGKMALLRQ